MQYQRQPDAGTQMSRISGDGAQGVSRDLKQQAVDDGLVGVGDRTDRGRLPLWKEATRALRAWLAVRGAVPTPEVFLNARGEALTTSGFTYIVKKHARVAAQQCPSLSKKNIAPHVLRHTSLKSTEIYLRADPTEKLDTIEKALPPDLRRGTFPVEDQLIAWLSGRKLSGVNPWEDTTNNELAIKDY